jgi:dTDP-4-amino-4,6-dideoxygalactose transaminase
MKSIPFFNYPDVFFSNEDAFLSIIRDVGRRGAFIMQKELVEFESNLAAFTGAKFAVGVGNATDALQLGLMGGGIRPGDEIIFSSHTMIATASAIHFAGAIPIPIEAGPDHLMNPEAIESAITNRTKAILPTQLNGRTANMKDIQKVANKHGLEIYEDAAQALGSKYKGKSAGTFGKASCVSFYPAKVLGCLGDGGAILTNDAKLYKNVLALRDHGRNENGDIHIWGMNSRLDNIQAAILDYQLKSYDKVIARRREIAKHYRERLGQLETLILPPGPVGNGDHYDVYQNYEIEAEQRDKLRAYLDRCGIGTLIQWGGKAVHQFRRLGFSQSLPYTEQLLGRMLMIPLNLSLTDDDIDYICDTIIKFYQ